MSHPPLVRTAHFALHMLRLDQLPADRPHPLFGASDLTWIGCVLPKRHARRAVTRNAIRRQIYAGMQRHGSGLRQAAWVARLQRGWELAACRSASSAVLRGQVRAELDDLFDSAAQRLTRLRGRSPLEAT